MVRAETLSAPGLCADGEAAAAGRATRKKTYRSLRRLEETDAVPVFRDECGKSPVCRIRNRAVQGTSLRQHRLHRSVDVGDVEHQHALAGGNRALGRGQNDRRRGVRPGQAGARRGPEFSVCGRQAVSGGGERGRGRAARSRTYTMRYVGPPGLRAQRRGWARSSPCL